MRRINSTEINKILNLVGIQNYRIVGNKLFIEDVVYLNKNSEYRKLLETIDLQLCFLDDLLGLAPSNTISVYDSYSTNLTDDITFNTLKIPKFYLNGLTKHRHELVIREGKFTEFVISGYPSIALDDSNIRTEDFSFSHVNLFNCKIGTRKGLISGGFIKNSIIQTLDNLIAKYVESSDTKLVAKSLELLWFNSFSGSLVAEDIGIRGNQYDNTVVKALVEDANICVLENVLNGSLKFKNTEEVSIDLAHSKNLSNLHLVGEVNKVSFYNSFNNSKVVDSYTRDVIMLALNKLNYNHLVGI